MRRVTLGGRRKTTGDEFLEVFTDTTGVVRVRLTPRGARSIGDEAMASALEACKQGRHGKFAESHPYCACGEQSIVVQDES